MSEALRGPRASDTAEAVGPEHLRMLSFVREVMAARLEIPVSVRFLQPSRVRLRRRGADRKSGSSRKCPEMTEELTLRSVRDGMRPSPTRVASGNCEAARVRVSRAVRCRSSIRPLRVRSGNGSLAREVEGPEGSGQREDSSQVLVPHWARVRQVEVREAREGSQREEGAGGGAVAAPEVEAGEARGQGRQGSGGAFDAS